MDGEWSGAGTGGGTDNWSGSATTVDYGNNIGRAYSNNTTLTGNDPTATPSTSGAFSSAGSGGGGSAGGGGGFSRNLNPKAQLSVDRMPYETSIETIRNIFGKYGRISRVICDYKITEERLNVWLDYEDERVGETALRENGKKMERSNIVVMKSSTGGGDDSFRSRAPKRDAFGNNTWNKDRGARGDRGGDGGGMANTSTTSTDADWAIPGDANTSSFGDSSFGDGEDRRSSRGRGRGGGGGGRDRGGGRSGGRGRGGGGGRYQPYDRSEPHEKAALPPWEEIVAGKSGGTPSASTSAPTDFGTDDWGNLESSSQPAPTQAPASSAPVDDGW